MVGSVELATIIFTGSKACPIVSADGLSTWIDEYWYLWGGVMMILGAFMAFLGRKLFQVTIFVCGMAFTTYVLMMCFYAWFFTSETEYWVGWTVLGVSALVGILVGFLLAKYMRFGAAVLAGFGGYCLGMFINTMVVYLASNNGLFWTVAIGMAVVCAIVGFFAFNHAIILSTSFAGGYLFGRGLSLYAGGYTDIFTLVDLIQAGAIDSINPWMYAYFALMLVVAIIGAVVQYKMFHKMKHTDQHPYHGGHH